ncbi:MAG: DUF1553 domain-containing protein [Verrucomicrobiales bacterium]|nr:DUF1553 domain-containing protein [Verrucomicrobiales bacterium]
MWRNSQVAFETGGVDWYPVMRLLIAAAFFVFSLSVLTAADFSLHEEITAAKPVAHWSFEDSIEESKNRGVMSGPVAPEYPFLPKENRALRLQNGGRIQIPDTGDRSLYDFDNGDEITVEAMVNPVKLNGQASILCKGRTYNKGFATTNQNWAFRLRSVGGSAGLNFLFHSRSSDGKPGEWHRWTSKTGVGVDTGWHHVAFTYRFGEPESIRGYIDGKEVKGTWDMGGATKAAPVVDNDEVWIGSMMAGNIGNSFNGGLDDIALYRRIISGAEMKTRYKRIDPPLVLPQAVPGKLHLSLHAPLTDHVNFPKRIKPAVATWEQSAMGFIRIPTKFDDWGVREDWGTAALVRAVTEIELEPGEYEFLARSRGIARLFIDGEKILDFPRAKRGGGAHNHVAPVPEVPREGMRPPAMDDIEKIASFVSKGGKHTVVFDVMVGGNKLRLEFGEGCVAIAEKGGMFRLLGPKPGPELTDDGWESFAEKTGAELHELDQNRRRDSDLQKEYWKNRHALAVKHLVKSKTTGGSIDKFIEARIDHARKNSGPADSFFNRQVRPVFAEHCYRCHGEKEKGDLNLQNRESVLAGGESGIPAVVPGDPHESFLIELVEESAGDEKMPPTGEGLTDSERAILVKWIKQGARMDKPFIDVGEVSGVVDDLTFLRRVWIDTVGVAPPLDVVRSFQADTDPEKRSKMISKLLNEDRWADNWVGYWQDVLAENPNLLKPNLNNTGPFRYWILESIHDNKPLDRFATELISMRGSTWGGGASGFSVASQNDVPMAAKAHIIGTAFLGVDMKCARCHDAPYHETTQQDLFEMAAMLKRNDIKVPSTSSVPASFFEHVQKGGRESLIEVTLQIGATVKPEWPFAELVSEIPEEVLQSEGDLRELIGAEVTFSRRFAEVIANRIWKRFMGAGLVEKVDDWEGRKPSDPELLSFLADELIRCGYDLKTFSSLILHSKAYQRKAIDVPTNLVDAERFFEGPYRRRMTAEQVVDNAWHTAQREMELGLLTMDMEGRLAPGYFMNFGKPKRAWEFTTLANERDRPSLAIPEIQAVVDVLLAFGWRNSRQEPTSHRIEEPNPIQPGVLANGVMGSWLTRLTDDAELTRMCIEAESVEKLIEDLFLQFLTRYPTEEEKVRFHQLLADGFDYRIVPETEWGPEPEKKRFPYVSWSNHLDSSANSIKQEREELARKGDPPTRYLSSTWREQAEDAIWALLNAPEMIMVP